MMKKTILGVLLSFLAVAAPAQDWRQRVTDAKRLEDPAARRDAMLKLLREALPGRQVELSGEKDAEYVHPDDNQPAPVINFDMRMNQKQSAKPRDGGATRSLQNNFGYYFSVNGVPYVVVGPAALDPRSPILTQLAIEHEMFHAEHHPGDKRSLNDRELETWSTMFVRFFPQVYQFNQQWRPMFGYYDEATQRERQAGVERLANFARNAEGPVRTAFDEWLDRRRKDLPSSLLVADLEVALAWEKKVDEAKKSPDAMLALVREAMPGIEVRMSGDTHHDQVHPEDNQPAPVVNFDPRMNEKSTYSSNSKPLTTSPAYYFVARGKPYVVAGPNVLNRKDPVFTRMHIAHELFHAKNHLGDPRPLPDRELETWTEMFVTYFREMIPFKQKWSLLVSFYEEADAGERKATLDRLLSYYKAGSPEVKAAFDEWLGRRKKDAETTSAKLVGDLVEAL